LWFEGVRAICSLLFFKRASHSRAKIGLLSDLVVLENLLGPIDWLVVWLVSLLVKPKYVIYVRFMNDTMCPLQYLALFAASLVLCRLLKITKTPLHNGFYGGTQQHATSSPRRLRARRPGRT
jgi:hypothetical protein